MPFLECARPCHRSGITRAPHRWDGEGATLPMACDGVHRVLPVCPVWPIITVTSVPKCRYQRGSNRVEGEGRNDMTALRRLTAQARQLGVASAASAGVFLRDVGQGLLEVSHNTLALLGLVAVGAVLFVGGRPDLRQQIEAQTLDWLQARQDARADPAELLAAQLAEPEAVQRATAANPKELTRQQAAVAQWISRRYRVAPEPISRLVKEAWTVGARVNLDPTLILAIMAVESSFNPFAQSSVGAQGLMQVITHMHDDTYEPFGG